MADSKKTGYTGHNVDSTASPEEIKRVNAQRSMFGKIAKAVGGQDFKPAMRVSGQTVSYDMQAPAKEQGSTWSGVAQLPSKEGLAAQVGSRLPGSGAQAAAPGSESVLAEDAERTAMLREMEAAQLHEDPAAATEFVVQKYPHLFK